MVGEIMEINICHLYPDLLNAYGDYGNILVLKYRCEQRGIKVNIVNISLGDDFVVEDYDIVFFGGGQDYEQSIVSPDLFTKAEKIKEYVEKGKVLLAICGGYQLLGKYYISASDEKIQGLDILNLHTDKGDKRFIGNVIIEDVETGEKYVGFENHSGRTILGEGVKPIGKILLGYGNNGEDGFEGSIYKNTFCSYFHGSMLSKNPTIADKLITLALKNKYDSVEELEKLDDSFEIEGKNHILKLLNK